MGGAAMEMSLHKFQTGSYIAKWQNGVGRPASITAPHASNTVRMVTYQDDSKAETMHADG